MPSSASPCLSLSNQTRTRLQDLKQKVDHPTKEELESNCSCFQCVYTKPVVQRTRSERHALPVPKYVKTLLNMALLTLVLVMIVGTVIAFCVQNKDKAMLLFLTRKRKRRREMEEALAREAAERAAKEAEENNPANWNPFFRYGNLAAMGAGAGMGFGYGSRMPVLK